MLQHRVKTSKDTNESSFNLEKTDLTETLIARIAMVSPPFPMLGSMTCR